MKSYFKVLYDNGAQVEVNVVYVDTQSLGDATAKVKQQPDQQPIPKIGSRLLHQGYLFRFKIGFHQFCPVVCLFLATLIYRI